MESFRMLHLFRILVLLFLATITIKFALSLMYLNMMLFYVQKLDVLGRERTPRINDDSGFSYYEKSFTIREVGSGSRWGKGIPQSLRAFARIMTCDSLQEVDDLAKEAAENDGRLAWKPLKNKNRELAAHQLLLLEVSRLMKDCTEHIKLLGPTPPSISEKSALTRRLALDLLTGELRVLKSASA